MGHVRIPVAHQPPDRAQPTPVDLDLSPRHIMDVGQLTENSAVVAVAAADSVIAVVVAGRLWAAAAAAVAVGFVAQVHHNRQWDQHQALVAAATNYPSSPVASHKAVSVAPVAHRRAYVDDNC